MYKQKAMINVQNTVRSHAGTCSRKNQKWRWISIFMLYSSPARNSHPCTNVSIGVPAENTGARATLAETDWRDAKHALPEIDARASVLGRNTLLQYKHHARSCAEKRRRAPRVALQTLTPRPLGKIQSRVPPGLSFAVCQCCCRHFRHLIVQFLRARGVVRERLPCHVSLSPDGDAAVCGRVCE